MVGGRNFYLQEKLSVKFSTVQEKAYLFLKEI